MNTSLFNDDYVNSKRIIYTPSDFAKISLTHLQEIGQLQAQNLHVSKRDHLSSYLFFVVLSGSGTLNYDGDTYHLTAGDCIFIDCHKAYSHATSEDYWNLKWVHFYGVSMANIYAKYVERGGEPVFHPQDVSDFLNIWEQLYETADSTDYIRDMKINEGLNALLTMLMAQSWSTEAAVTTSKKNNLLDIKKYLDEHYPDKITLDDLSETFFINKFYLTRIFKLQFGVTLNDYLLHVRITHAKQLLRFTDKTVETIGLECGMGSVHYFSRMFKKVEGLAPSEYRRKW